ncbi:Ig-like domain-containing protein [Microbacterium sp. 1.5R]|uniref:Ig-like domain-containing protein n=1 Tax=Microbacterium sp. 1.5R TaxID=1916917 RepID=UPI0011A7F81D|nr:Ig-like domain-containing protein [Microbacterium sp. 1.5R]
MQSSDVTIDRKGGRRRGAIGARLATIALVASAIVVGVPAAPAVAAPALSCIGTIYLTNSGDQSVRALDLASGTVGASPVFPIPAAGTGTNQLGIGAAGASALYGTATNLVKYVAASDSTTLQPKPTGVAQGTVGAVNPRNGLFYYGAFSGPTLRVFTFDPATDTASPNPVASISITASPGANGDIAFDKAGRLYVVAASTTAYALYVVDGAVPTVSDGTTTGAALTSSEIARGTTTAATNGIAFASDGYLYLGGSTSVQKANPITGATVGSPITMTGVTSNDLATCANPSTVEVTSTFPDGKRRPADSTTLIVEGGSYGAAGTGPDFGPSSVNPDGSSSTEPGVVLPGETYTVRQVGNGDTNLGDYTTTWSCRDLLGRVVASGTGNSASYTVATGTDGSSVVCAFVNELRPPTAVPDTASVTFGTPSVTLDGAANDARGTGAIRPELTVFTDPAATDGGTRLDTAEGRWTIGADGRITFAPAAGYSGTTPAVGYRITDDNGQTATSTATVTVAPGPSATADTATTTQATPVDIAPLTNDTPGEEVDGSSAPIPPASLTFPPTGQPAGASVSADGRSVSVPGEGAYVIDPTTGVVTFTPEPTFFGTAQPVAYSFTDAVGNPAGSTITVTVTAVAPTATPDAADTPFATPVTIDVVANDAAGPGGELDPTKTVFTDPAATADGTRLVTPEGTWSVEQSGSITFTPADGYTGTTPAVGYRITDDNGQTATSTVTVTVRPGPSATADTGATDQNVDVVIALLPNDAPGRRADGSAGAFDPATVRLLVTADLPSGSAVSGDGRRLRVAGEGVYTVDPADGRVTFDPDPQFTGAASTIGYEVEDQAGNTASSTVTVTVRPITPVLTDDAAKTPGEVPVELDPLANDNPGDPSVPLAPDSVRFTSPDATDDGTALETPEGSWSIDDDGRIRFEPAPGFEGVTAPVEYEARDANGTRALARVTVTVGGGALAAPDSETTRQGRPVQVKPLANDVASDLGAPCDAGEPGVPAGCDTGELLATSVVFPTVGQPDGSTVGDGGKTVAVPGEGVYAIDASTGVVTFTPEPAFTGTAQPVTYAVTDSLGATVAATVTITVTAVTPVAVDDTARTPFDTPVSIDLLANDDAGDDLAPLVAERTVFPADGQAAGAVVADDGKTLTIPGEGT